MKSFAPTIGRLVALLAECACRLCGGRYPAAERGLLPSPQRARGAAGVTTHGPDGTESPSVMGGWRCARKQTWRQIPSPAT